MPTAPRYWATSASRRYRLPSPMAGLRDHSKSHRGFRFMGEITRLSLSLESELLDELERAIAGAGASNRSEFVRSLLRNHLAGGAWMQAATVVAVVSYTYDHHTSGINDGLVRLQHDARAEVLVSTHLHLSHHSCLEMLVVRGAPDQVRQLEAGLRQLRGVDHVSLTPMHGAAPSGQNDGRATTRE
ncbi:MAG: nickel-responsive transcriptional regulator NikR [Planctomycetota bacterium]|nr:MAG: nickel-responsive transcriptional regulator NikR [Planctomycetota bacterium]